METIIIVVLLGIIAGSVGINISQRRQVENLRNMKERMEGDLESASKERGGLTKDVRKSEEEHGLELGKILFLLMSGALAPSEQSQRDLPGLGHALLDGSAVVYGDGSISNIGYSSTGKISREEIVKLILHRLKQELGEKNGSYAILLEQRPYP